MFVGREQLMAFPWGIPDAYALDEIQESLQLLHRLREIF